MGNNLDIIKKSISNMKPCSLFELSLTKLREYHGIFKSVCENFSIDQSEFKEIFHPVNDVPLEKLEDIFKLWDNNKNGLIDALELFSGLILFAQGNFQEKIRFLFDIFDLNELNSLSLVDIEYMINCCVSSTFRICKSQEEVNQKEIDIFVARNLPKDQRINISKLIFFGCQSEEIRLYLTYINRQLPEKEELTLNEFVLKVEDPDFLIPKYLKKNIVEFIEGEKQALQFQNTGQILNEKSHINKQKFLNDFLKKIVNDQQNKANKNCTISLNWVYGFRCDDMLKSFIFHQDKESKNDFKLIYFVSNVVVIFYYKRNSQKHYREHKNKICSIAQAKYKNLIATGDSGKQPFIYIWDINTLQTIYALRACHSYDIFSLEFINQDQFIVSLSLRSNTPIQVYDISNKQLILSFYFNTFIYDIIKIDICAGNEIYQQIFNEKNTYDLEKSFFTFSDNAFYFIYHNQQTQQYEKKTYITQEKGTSIQTYNNKYPKITSMVSIFLNINNPYLMVYQELTNFELIVITGHSDGKLYKWINLDQESYEKVDFHQEFNSPINQIQVIDKKNLLILLEENRFAILNLESQQVLGSIELSQVNLTLRSQQIKNIQLGNKSNIFFSTWEGEIVKLAIKYEKKSLIEQQSITIKKVKKYNNVLQLKDKFRCMSLLERDSEKIVFIAGDDSQIYGFSHNGHELIDQWTVGDKITAMDCINSSDGGIIFAFGTEQGNIILRQDWEELPKAFTSADKKKILDLKFNKEGQYLVACCANNIVYIFIKSNDNYFDCNYIQRKFENEIPISINFFSDQKNVIIGTNQKRHYKMELPNSDNAGNDHGKELIENQNINNLPQISLRCPVYYHKRENVEIETIESIPIIFGNENNIILSGDEYGSIEIWNNQNDLQQNAGTFYMGHSSTIVDIIQTQDKTILYSLALEDNALFEWKLDYAPLEAKSTYHEATNIKTIQREILASKAEIFKKDNLKDSFALFKGTTKKDLNRFHLEPPNYDPKNKFNKMYPQISIKLEHVYGFFCSDKRNTLFYYHDYKNGNPQKQTASLLQDSIRDQFKSIFMRMSGRKKSEKFSLLLQNDEAFRSSMLKGKEKDTQQSIEELEPEDLLMKMFQDSQKTEQEKNGYCQNSGKCVKELVYIASRIAIIVSRKKIFKQRFYEAHKYQISCIDIHANKDLAATGEIALNPTIHIWFMKNCSNYRIIQTYHKVGIVTVKLSCNQTFLYSIGVDQQASIQVTDWELNEIIGFRYTSTELMIDMAINPKDERSFVTGSVDKIDFWRVIGNSIVHENQISLFQSGFVSNLTFICYKIDDLDVQDILATTLNGQVHIIRDDHSIICKDLKQNSEINCLKTFTIQNKFFFIFATRDQNIIISDFTLKRLFKINLESQFDQTELKSKQKEATTKIEDISEIQSLDIFLCENSFKPYILIGTKGGYIFEISLSYNPIASSDSQFSLIQLQLLIKNHSANTLNKQQPIEQQTMKLNDFFFKNNKKIFISIYPINHSTIMASIGDDQTLYLWDYLTKELIAFKNHPNPITVCKFSNDGKYLVIGGACGDLTIHELKISKSSYKNKYEIDLSQFHQIQSETQTAILNIEFSNNPDQGDSKMAVSYDNSQINLEKIDTPKEKEGAFIHIFDLNQSKKQKQEIRLPSTYKTGVTSTEAYGRAVYFMCFSEDNNYLMLYYQTISNSLIRVNSDSQGQFCILDLKSQSTVTQYNKIVVFNRNKFPNHIFGKQSDYPDSFSGELFKIRNEDINLEIKKSQIIISAINDIGNYSFLGSEDGYIYVVKNEFFDMPEDKLPFEIDLKNYVQGRQYPSHVSFVNIIEKSPNLDRLFTTGINDEVIFQWKIQKISDNHELDHRNLQLEEADLVLYDVDDQISFENFLTINCYKRSKIVEINDLISKDTFPRIQFQVHKIFGRKAFNRKNNIVISKNKQLIYTAGTSLVMYNFDNCINRDNKNEKQMKQSFVFPEDFRIPAEISMITIAPNKEHICFGTIEKNSYFRLMDITSKSLIKAFILYQLVVPLQMQFSYDSKFMAIQGINNFNQSCIYFINPYDGVQHAVITFNYSINFKIKDLKFVPFKNNEFITVGIHHISHWYYIAGTLQFKEYEIESKQENINNIEIQEKEEQEVQLKIFQALCFLTQTIFVTTSEKGKIYVWRDQKQLITQKFNENDSFLAIKKLEKESQSQEIDFIVGSNKGQIIYFRFNYSNETNYELIKVIEFSIIQNVVQNELKLKYEIQSLEFLNEGHIIYGTRSGDIGEIKYQFKENQVVQSNFKTLTEQDLDISKTHFLNFFDKEIPIACKFSKNEEILFTITSKGLLTKYEIESMKQLKQLNFDKKIALDLIILDKIIIIVMERELIMLKNDDEMTIIDSDHFEFQMNILKTVVNKQQTLMAIAFERKEPSELPDIQLYDIRQIPPEQLPTIKTDEEVNLIDFTQDGFYMVCQENNLNKTYFVVKDPKNIQEVKTVDLGINLAWMSEGLKLSDQIYKINNHYPSNNPIKHIIKYKTDTIIVTDEVGTIRVFEFPCETNYYRVYSNHLCDINIASIGENYFVTSSSEDKTIIIWKIVENVKEDFLESTKDGKFNKDFLLKN